ncbi:waprin-Phi1-like [Portunus trituberculatus]|uniref:waprin-Phi1-like n=1 Tax=Portunus trituberculatus TaxID=210409 RepID=UPI001E1CEE6B|nr:waprin-Phi1-like [Portunus trituberculatus]
MHRGLCVLAVVMVAVCVGHVDGTCTTFCTHPLGPEEGYYICCDRHPGKCPAEPECDTFSDPCHYDPDCQPHQKCCRNSCGGNRCTNV